MRQINRRPKTKREVLTLGGQGDYVVSETEMKDLVRMLLQTKNPQNMRRLVSSLFTNRELADVVRRIMIAKLITQGQTYETIVGKAQASKPTISLIRKMLRFNPDIVSMLNPTMKWDGYQKNIVKRIRRGK